MDLQCTAEARLLGLGFGFLMSLIFRQQIRQVAAKQLYACHSEPIDWDSQDPSDLVGARGGSRKLVHELPPTSTISTGRSDQGLQTDDAWLGLSEQQWSRNVLFRLV